MPMPFGQTNPLAAAIQSMMSSGGMSGSGGGFPSTYGGGGMTRMPNMPDYGGASVNPLGGGGGMSSLMTAIRSMMGNPLARGGQSGMGGGATDPWAVSRQMAGVDGGIGNQSARVQTINGLGPDMLMMHLMGGGSLGSLMQMMQARQGQQGPQGGMAPQMNPAGGMMSAYNRTMAR